MMAVPFIKHIGRLPLSQYEFLIPFQHRVIMDVLLLMLIVWVAREECALHIT